VALGARIEGENGKMGIPQLTAEKYNKILADYEKKTPKSKKLYKEANRYISPSGAPAYMIWHRPYPFFVKKAEGSRVFDVDDNEYVDLFMDQGISIIGHNPPRVRESIARTMDKYGVHLELCEELATEWAKKVNKHFPSCKRIKIVNSGNEATALAVQIARAYTGRDKVIKFQGHHHGWNAVLSYDGLVAGSGTLFTKGIPENHWENLIALPINDVDKLKGAIKENKDEIAAVIMEPMGATTGGPPFQEGFQKEVRELTEENDILLIFDEVVTAFRVALGGAQEVLGITPDITVFGKAVGGGIPIGAVGGSEDIMGVLCVLDSKADCFGLDRIFPMGSFCAQPLAMAAGIATIEELEQGDYIRNSILRAEELTEGINEVAKALKADFSAYNIYSIVHFGLAEKIKSDLSNALDWLEFNQMVRLILLLNDPGVVTLPGHVYMSGVHTKEDIDTAILAFENCLKVYKE